MKTLISVIITNYNYGEYIEQAIKSVLNQTYKNIELIVINDGSTDNSSDIIKKSISDNPGRSIRYVDRNNKGVVYTRNEGLRLANGEFLCYLDADDYFDRDYIAKNYKIAVEYDADVVYPNWHYVGEWLGRPDTDFPEFTPKLLQLQKLHCTPASLIRKAAVNGHRFETEEVAEDWDFFIGLSLDGARFKLAKDNHLNYRIRHGTRGSKNNPKDDTDNFVKILTKYRNKYGDKVINPKKLVSLRHPNIIRRIMSARPLVATLESVKHDGVRTTVNKIIAKTLLRSRKVRGILLCIRNNKYKSTLESFKVNKSPKSKLAIIVHLYYPDLWPTIVDKMRNIDTPFDLFVSVQECDKGITLDKVSKYHQTTNIIALPNRGRDVLPFLLIVKKISNEGYEYLLKLHSKKSTHREDGNEWMRELLDELIPTNISNIIKTLEKTDTGIVGPANHVVSLSRYMGANKERIKAIIELIPGNEISPKRILEHASKYPFFGGTMFWSRVDFLLPLLNTNISPGDFNSEKGQVDGTTAHAIERILGKMLHEISNRKMYIIVGTAVKKLPDKSYNDKYKYVD